MPLSEDEQRILRQIEQELEQDPTFAERGVRVSRRRLVLGAVGTVVALFVTVVSLAVSFVASFVAFAVALALGAVVVGEVRLIGRERLGESPLAAWLAAARSQRPG
jgi:hypothetical protein